MHTGVKRDLVSVKRDLVLRTEKLGSIWKRKQCAFVVSSLSHTRTHTITHANANTLEASRHMNTYERARTRTHRTKETYR
jgi:hypothetical protein